MKNLNDETRKENRAILVLVIVIAMICVLAIYGYSTGAWE
jgi:hypothetical protein